jgi:transcription elongation factor GreA
MKDKTLYLTQEGAEKISQDLEVLRGPKRAELARRLREAIEMGDLSENADYIAAKEAQAFLEGKIQELEVLLRDSVIIETSRSNGVVNIGNFVTITIDEREPETFHLVGVKEANAREGKISHQSPIGKALLGRKRGDSVFVETPAGESKLTLLDIG